MVGKASQGQSAHQVGPVAQSGQVGPVTHQVNPVTWPGQSGSGRSGRPVRSVRSVSSVRSSRKTFGWLSIFLHPGTANAAKTTVPPYDENKNEGLE